MCYGKKLRSKDSLFYSLLFLGEPINKCHVHEDHIACTGVAISLVSRMVTIYHHPKIDIPTPRTWGVDKNCFINVPILLRPVLGLECLIVDRMLVRRKLCFALR